MSIDDNATRYKFGTYADFDSKEEALAYLLKSIKEKVMSLKDKEAIYIRVGDATDLKGLSAGTITGSIPAVVFTKKWAEFLDEGIRMMCQDRNLN